MSKIPIRDFLKERKLRIKQEWKSFQQAIAKDEDPSTKFLDSDFKRLYHGSRTKLTEEEQSRAYQSEFNKLLQTMKIVNEDKHEPFEFFTPREEPVPPHRLPAHGIELVKMRYHKGRTVSITDKVPETGHLIDPPLLTLLQSKYPEYLSVISRYCRPLGTTDATFADFNKPQYSSAPTPTLRKQRILKHVHRILHTSPYLPLHFVDTQYAGLPLNTGTGYHNRNSFKTKIHAKFSRPDEYADRPTSKGYFVNAFLQKARTLIHLIKDNGFPFPYDENDDIDTLVDKLNKFFNEYPTTLYTRNHVSKRDEKLKQRPVYAADELFLIIETMLTFPLLVQARHHACAIMYGLETIRGSNVYLDSLAVFFRTFFTIDWSAFDQTLAREITDTYYHDFLPSLIIINKAYQPTHEYPTYPDLDEHKMYHRMRNLLTFLHMWYNNMTFLSPDGFAYRRTRAGVPSGILNTQYLDSFGNIYILVDAFIEFGLTDHEIEQVVLFVMGDDNSGFTTWPITKLEQFFNFLVDYASTRWNMTISANKSVITTQRQNIETLSYKCNFGKPSRSIDKLVAQLCYPERGMRREYMSYRAIGIAYAACGSDTTFHKFCSDVYMTYRPYARSFDEIALSNIQNHLPGYLKMLDSIDEYIDFEQFPDIRKIQRNLESWKGPLSYAPKWNYAHFIHPPDKEYLDALTLADYEKVHSLEPSPPPQL